MIQAESVMTGLATKREEVELMAVGKLAVFANGFDVLVHSCV